jgi:Protein of unknown function (DUF1501)
MKTNRRVFLKGLSGVAAAAAIGLPPGGAIAQVAAEKQSEFFVFIIALGGWDVTLWSDPRNELSGIVHPASTENTDTSQLRRWVDAPLGDGAFKTFALVRPKGSNLVFGPGIGDLADMADRVTVVNGLQMNTVAHPDGQVFSTTGRHPEGGRVAASSIDTILSNEFGREQLFPTVSVRYPSSYVGEHLDRRVVPLVVEDVGAISRTLARETAYDVDSERDRVTALLSEEATDLAKRATYPDVLEGLGLQYESLRRMLSSHLQEVFSGNGLRQAHPEFDYKARFTGAPAVNAAFGIEAMKRNVVRCVSFAIGGFDTHQSNYRTHAQLQQETFGLVASMVRSLDVTPHPTVPGARLSDHTHILVVSDFCRTPQINLGMGRDHYPNNSALVISPRFKANFVFGKTDPEQLLPQAVRKFTDGDRAIAPPDLLATFVGAFGVDPRKYMRDGEIVPEPLRS